MMEGGAKASDGSDDPSSSSSKVEHHNLQSIDEGVSYVEPLTLEIPPIPIYTSNHDYDDRLIQLQGPPSGSSLPGGFLGGGRLKHKPAVHDGETSSLLKPEFAANSDDKLGPERAVLANVVAALSWKRCLSLPATSASNISPSSPAKEKIYNELQVSQKRPNPVKVARSLSVPIRNIVVVRSGSFPCQKESTPANPPDGRSGPSYMEYSDEEIPEEEAVCRICLIGLNEGCNWLKMECSCKGALRLIHEECAVKWFSIKGNKQCDVCGQEVLNLPVTLFRAKSPVLGNAGQQHPRRNTSFRPRSWQDVVVLILISTMCYFFFIEQLLINDLRSKAIIVAAPCSLTLGLLGSMFAIILSFSEYVWAYSAFQFSLVVIFLHVFYTMIQLKAVFSILFASFAGFGMAMGVNTLCLHFMARRARAIRTQMNTTPV